MANVLCADLKEDIRQLFLSCGSIRKVARELGVGKNTVRRLVRAEGLALTPGALNQSPVWPSIQDLDFRMLEKLFSKSGEPTEMRGFERHIKSMAVEIANEIGVRGRLDVTRLEVAICEYIQYRRFLFCSLEISDRSYSGPFAKSHDKAAKAVLKYVEASNRAFENFNRVCRELEVKYGKRGQDLNRQTNVFVQQNQQFHLGQKSGLDATAQNTSRQLSKSAPEASELLSSNKPLELAHSNRGR